MLWTKIGYAPPTEVVEIESDEEQIVEAFTPKKTQVKEGLNYSGVIIKHFPLNLDES